MQSIISSVSQRTFNMSSADFSSFIWRKKVVHPFQKRMIKHSTSVLLQWRDLNRYVGTNRFGDSATFDSYVNFDLRLWKFWHAAPPPQTPRGPLSTGHHGRNSWGVQDAHCAALDYGKGTTGIRHFPKTHERACFAWHDEYPERRQQDPVLDQRSGSFFASAAICRVGVPAGWSMDSAHQSTIEFPISLI